MTLHALEMKIVKELRVALSDSRITKKNIAAWYTDRPSAVKAASKPNDQIVEVDALGVYAVYNPDGV